MQHDCEVRSLFADICAHGLHKLMLLQAASLLKAELDHAMPENSSEGEHSAMSPSSMQRAFQVRTASISHMPS